jgi:ligand-binding SRPBCC domain-containing protein
MNVLVAGSTGMVGAALIPMLKAEGDQVARLLRTGIAAGPDLGDRRMKLYTLNAEQWIARPPEELFPFFADAGNLEQLTPPWLHFRIVSSPVEIRAGARISYRLRLHGIQLAWQSEITAWEPPFRFVDEQTRGPYRAWIHEHTFESGDGGTLMRDTVQYAARGGPLVRKCLVAPDLEKIFKYRRARLESIFGGSH